MTTYQYGRVFLHIDKYTGGLFTAGWFNQWYLVGYHQSIQSEVCKCVAYAPGCGYKNIDISDNPKLYMGETLISTGWMTLFLLDENITESRVITEKLPIVEHNVDLLGLKRLMFMPNVISNNLSHISLPVSTYTAILSPRDINGKTLPEHMRESDLTSAELTWQINKDVGLHGGLIAHMVYKHITYDIRALYYYNKLVVGEVVDVNTNTKVTMTSAKSQNRPTRAITEFTNYTCFQIIKACDCLTKKWTWTRLSGYKNITKLPRALEIDDLLSQHKKTIEFPKLTYVDSLTDISVLAHR